MGTSNIMKGGSRDGNLSIWGGLIYWDFELWLRGSWGWSISLRGSSVKGTWRGGGLPPRDSEGYLEKSLGRVSLYIGAPLLGNLEEGMLAGDFEVWIKGLRLYPSGDSTGSLEGGLLYWVT